MLSLKMTEEFKDQKSRKSQTFLELSKLKMKAGREGNHVSVLLHRNNYAVRQQTYKSMNL